LVMSKKVAIFAFNGEIMCFAHAMINALEMRHKGYDVKLIIEGMATGAIAQLSDNSKPFSELYQKVRDEGLIDCVCLACSTKTGTAKQAEEQGLRLCGEMSGHPSMSRYIDAGYDLIVM